MLLPSTIKKLCNISSKPAGRGLALAFTVALEDLITMYPKVEILIKGFHKSLSILTCNYMYWESCFKCNTTYVAHDADNARHFGKHLEFPESNTYDFW
jgi:hypothetical protein